MEAIVPNTKQEAAQRIVRIQNEYEQRVEQITVTSRVGPLIQQFGEARVKEEHAAGNSDYKWTLTELQELTGIPYPSIMNWSKDRITRLDMETIGKFLALFQTRLDVTICDLLAVED